MIGIREVVSEAIMLISIYLMLVKNIKFASAETMSPQVALTTMHYAEVGMGSHLSQASKLEPASTKAKKPPRLNHKVIAADHRDIKHASEDLAPSFNDGANQQLSLRLVVTDPEQSLIGRARAGVNQTRHTSSNNLKRPYDLQFMSSNRVDDLYSSSRKNLHGHLDKHFYTLDTDLSSMSDLKKRGPTVVFDDKLEEDDTLYNYDTASSGNKLTTKKKTNSYRSELVRTQHRPPWHRRHNQAQIDHNRKQISDLISERRSQSRRYTTMSPSLAAATTEFFKLMSSAHSPIKYDYADEPRTPTTSSQPEAQHSHHHESVYIDQNYHRTGLIRARTRTSRAPLIFENQPSESSQPKPLSHPFEGKIVSPEIVVQGGDSESETSQPQQASDTTGDLDHSGGDYDQTNGTLVRRTSNSGVNQVQHQQQTDITSKEISSSIQFDDDQELSSRFRPVTFYNGKKPVTIILQSSSKHHHKKRPPPQQPPSLAPSPPPSSGPQYQPSRHQQYNLHLVPAPSTKSPIIVAAPDRSRVTIASTNPPYLVRLISKQKHKYDDKVLSPTLTVVDNDANRLPPNSTSVHNNKLVVVLKPGRPKRRHPPTTQFPVYNIVAGITPPYPPNPTPAPQWRPPTHDGSVYGLLKPTNNPSTTVSDNNQHHHTTQASLGQFGAANVKFPAAEPSHLQPEHASPNLPDKFNLTVPDSANIVTPGRIPDKIVLETGEETHSRPPGDAVVVSDSHNISRPPGGSNTTITNQDGVMRLKSTTRRPGRPTPTQRVNIMSANTTVVTTNPEELHDVLSNFIAGHHQHHHAYQDNNRPNHRPGLVGYILGIFNNSIVTSVMAILTLVKTIFVALLVMFLPPMALAAAIIQTIHVG